MSSTIFIHFTPSGEFTGIEIMADTEEGQKTLEPTARWIKRFLDHPPLYVRLTQLLVHLTKKILIRLKFNPRWSLMLDRLIPWSKR
jgi:hypothetical protein